MQIIKDYWIDQTVTHHRHQFISSRLSPAQPAHAKSYTVWQGVLWPLPSQQYDRSSEGGDKWRRNLTMRFPCSSQPHTLRSLKANQRESSEIVPCTLLNRTYVRACVPAPAAEPARLPPLTRRSWFDYPLYSTGQVSAASEIRRKQRGRDRDPPNQQKQF